MRLTGSAVDVVERAYDLDASTTEWLTGVRTAAERAFSGQLAANAFVFRASVDGTFTLLQNAPDIEMFESFKIFHAQARPEVIRRVYLSGPVSSLSAALIEPVDDPLYAITATPFGLEEVWGSIGLDPSGLGCALAFPTTSRFRLDRSTRHALERVAAHLASAVRLRERGARGETSVMDDADAVLAPDGSVLHAAHEARGLEARTALRDAARRMDRARLKSERRDNESALDLWRALVDGRWSLVETFESDGRRVLVARRNDPTCRRSQALTPLERKVVALLAVGHSLKLCAYDLGRAQSTIHAIAASGMAKLGVRSRAELVELHGALVSSDEAET